MDNKTTNGEGHVEFRQPAAKLVADLPGDPEMRDHLDEMMAENGSPGACSVIRKQEKQE